MTTVTIAQTDTATGLFNAAAQTAVDARVIAAGPVFNVRASGYGAKGDGVTNDAPAFAAALSAAAAAGGGTVFVPQSTAAYVLVAGITVPAGVHLVGPGATLHSTVTSGATITAQSGSRLAHFSLTGSRSAAPLTPIGVYAANAVGLVLDGITVAEFTQACVQLFQCVQGTLRDVNLLHAISGTGTAKALDLQDGYNNGIQIIGGYLHSADIGLYTGSGASHVKCSAIVESNTVGWQYGACDAVEMGGYFENNTTTIKGAVAGYDNPASGITINTAWLNPSAHPTLGALTRVSGAEILMADAAPSASGAASGNVLTIGDGAQNVHVRSAPYVVCQNELGLPVHTQRADNVREQMLTYSRAFSNAAWALAFGASAVEDAATDGTTLLDGTAPLRLIVSGTCSSTNPARISQQLASYKGHVVGSRVWVRCATGKTGGLCPHIGGTTAVTGSNTNLPHRLQITDQWREITWTAGLPASDASANTFVGWYVWPVDGQSFTDFYFAEPQAWLDSLEPPQYVETTSTAVARIPVGGLPRAKQTLPAAATDAATTQALANALRAALIAMGVAQ